MTRKKWSVGHRLKLRHIEHRVIRHGQPIQRQHAKHRGKSREQNRHFKRHNDERRPRIQRPPGNVDRIGDVVDPPLQRESCRAAQQSADQAHQRHAVLVETDGLRKLFQRKRRVGVDLPIAGAVSAPRRVITSSFTLSNSAIRAVGAEASFTDAPPSALTVTCACGNSVFNSEIETAGSTRMNRNMQAAKNPSVPHRMAQSICVG